MTAKPKAPAAKKPKPTPSAPKPTPIDRAAFLETWTEGAAIVDALYDRLTAVTTVFFREPNHPGTFWIDADHLIRVANRLEQLVEAMQAGPLIATVSFPRAVGGGA